jgi:SulP family sulfate permease
MIAILEAQRAGLLVRRNWAPNIIAGVIVGVVALPLAMAFAIATGVKPEQGLYTAIIAGLVVSLFGGSRVQIAGPTGAFVVVLAGIVVNHGYAGLQLATLMAGAILILMGLFRMGAILRFIPAPVIVGFTAGIGVVIWVGQWPAFFGLPAPEGERLHQKLPHLFRSLADLHVATTALACLGLAILILVPRIKRFRRIPGPLIALVIVTLIQVAFGFDGVATIGSAFGGIPTGLPAFTPPGFSLDLMIDLLGPAFTIAMLGAIESLLSAVVADGMAGTRHDSNQELTGQGIANLASAAFGGIAATGAIARTATNIRNGGTSPIAGIVHSLVLVAIILVLAPLAGNIPLAVLASILFVVAWNMSDVKHFVRMARRAPIADVAILVVTFLLTVFADLVVAVNVGVLLATLHFLRRMSSSVDVQEVSGVHIGNEHRVDGGAPLLVPDGVLVYAIQGPFFFAAVESFERALAQTHTDPQVLVIRLNRMPFVDITGLQTIEEVIEDVGSRDVRVVLCEANTRVKTKLTRAGIIGDRRDDLYRDSLPEALGLAGRLVGDHVAIDEKDPVTV